MFEPSLLLFTGESPFPSGQDPNYDMSPPVAMVVDSGVEPTGHKPELPSATGDVPPVPALAEPSFPSPGAAAATADADAALPTADAELPTADAAAPLPTAQGAGADAALPKVDATGLDATAATLTGLEATPEVTPPAAVETTPSGTSGKFSKKFTSFFKKSKKPSVDAGKAPEDEAASGALGATKAAAAAAGGAVVGAAGAAAAAVGLKSDTADTAPPPEAEGSLEAALPIADATRPAVEGSVPPADAALPPPMGLTGHAPSDSVHSQSGSFPNLPPGTSLRTAEVSAVAGELPAATDVTAPAAAHGFLPAVEGVVPTTHISKPSIGGFSEGGRAEALPPVEAMPLR